MPEVGAVAKGQSALGPAFRAEAEDTEVMESTLKQEPGSVAAWPAEPAPEEPVQDSSAVAAEEAEALHHFASCRASQSSALVWSALLMRLLAVTGSPPAFCRHW